MTCSSSLIALSALLLAGLANPTSLFAQPREPVVDRPLEGEEAARTMRVADGFRVTLFAGEPDVRQPIGFCIDDRGRLWVAEAYNYPTHGTTPGDRIVILEDADGDGRHDRRSVFYDGLNYVTGIEVGFGGVWVMSPPFFFFLADRDLDDRPDGEPEILLDGFGNHANAHNLANGLAWGPDGWLYCTHGRTNWSLVGKPGAALDQRTRFDGGVFRYHPIDHRWESFADGTTNPWGIDWNDVGDAFVSNCVTPHLYHVIQGAHYEPWRNRDSSRHAYERIPAIADHLHFVGRGGVREGLFSPEEDAAGGGHAHAGALVYLGGSWPASYRNAFLTCNIHGKRINVDLPVESGSGYTAAHGKDLLLAADPWFTGVTLQSGPDGSVFVSDWSDTGECHHVENTRRDTGRIYKISYGETRAAPVNLAGCNSDELGELHGHPNEWHVRHARRILHERSARGDDLTDAAEKLISLFRNQPDVPGKLRALWTLFVIGRLDEPFLLAQLDHESEAVRSWSVRLLCERPPPGRATLEALAALAAREPSPSVRLSIASALQRIPLDERWTVLSPLLQREEDARDANLPLMEWYALEPLVDADLPRFVSLAQATRIPLIARHIARRAASHRESAIGLSLLTAALSRQSAPFQAAVLQGLLDGLAGRRSVPMPETWEAASPRLTSSADATVRDLSLELALVFDDPRAIASQRQLAVDPTALPGARARALDSLVRKHVPDLAPFLMELLTDPSVQRSAIRGLGEYDDPQTSPTLIAAYARLAPESRLDALQTLASRPLWASDLLDAVADGRIPRRDLTAYTVRQIDGLGDPMLRQQLLAVWGELRATPQAKLRQVREFKSRLTATSLAAADRSAGRQLFEKSCANCHRLFGEGGTIGPDITGSQRMNLDYLLQTLVDPGAAVAREYQLEVIETTGGRVWTGIVVDETDFSITVQSVNERVAIPRQEIETRQPSDLSMMPEGLLQNLTTDEVRALVAYLMSPEQVDFPSESEKASPF
jgi:putative membrane-bound dehydrogenase-like protein